MDAPLVDDDICILNHEKSDFKQGSNQESPISASSGDESVASHFALVTAYEDIKKRLKETERENSILKKRIRLLEDKVLGTCQEGKNSIGREQVNKAYQAYREICIERDGLQAKLDKMTKEQQESVKSFTEQLQSKEVELLQLRTEIETHQVISNFSQVEIGCTIEKVNSDLKMHSLQQEVEILRNECNRLRAELQKQKDQLQQTASSSNDFLQGRGIPNGQVHRIIGTRELGVSVHEGLADIWSRDCVLQDREDCLLQAFWELKREMSNLHLVTEVQAKVLRKLNADLTVSNKATSHLPVQCVEDVEHNCKVQLTSSGAFYKRPHSTLKGDNILCNAVAPPIQPDTTAISPGEIPSPWTAQRPNPVGSAAFQDYSSYQRSSLDDNSWVVPSPPKPSDIQFWEPRNNPPLTRSPVNYLD